MNKFAQFDQLPEQARKEAFAGALNHLGVTVKSAIKALPEFAQRASDTECTQAIELIAHGLGILAKPEQQQGDQVPPPEQAARSPVTNLVGRRRGKGK